jgi:hypothetical protein
MTARHDACGSILRREIIKSPHHSELQLESCDLNRIGRIVPMKLLVALPRQYLDPRGAANLVVGARRQENGIGDSQDHWVCDQCSAARRITQYTATPKRLRATEVRALTFIKGVERQSKLRGAGVDQVERR